ncbi:tyrosine-type recombinase/integrase [Bremerella alba]|uniref:Tyr recombinase domain-containing protein n=1 Tax=Bremerella alba TaxID=980252 RepID=A0A7V9A738_9BACT|nr:tyrosine-type recombinase/integrase [Bremerella alba]MBA2115025.1 hypothetical protein [Bremerella alba]
MAKANTGRKRRSRGRAWYWRQTDTWYFTPPGTKRRVRLVDERGNPVRGQSSIDQAELALARVKAAGDWRPEVKPAEESDWIVAKVCSIYIENCEKRSRAGEISIEYEKEVRRFLQDLCKYCGALPLCDLRKTHVLHWVETHSTWKSSATRRFAIEAVMAAFNHAQNSYSVSNPLRGLTKPAHCPRLHSFSTEDERALYDATDEPYRDFLFAAIHTGLRPFSELAQVTGNDVVESDRGMMWRVYASKTKKTRVIPIRKEVAELTRSILSRDNSGTDGVIFRNSQGDPWKKVTGGSRFRNLRQKIGWIEDSKRKNYSCYTCRHTFAHRMLAGYWTDGVGCSIEVLAELMGDTPKVAFDHYGKEWGQHFQDPLWAAIGVD